MQANGVWRGGRHAWRALLGGALLLALILSSCSAPLANPWPEAAAEAWLQALASGDGTKLNEVTCQAQRPAMGNPASLYRALGLANLAGMGSQPSLDVGGLDYEAVAKDEQQAQVRVSGPLTLSQGTTSQTVEANYVFRIAMEDGQWHFCGIASAAPSIAKAPAASPSPAPTRPQPTASPTLPGPSPTPGLGTTASPTAGGRTDVGLIAYEGLDGNIWLVNADGSNKRKLTSASQGKAFANPRWSPDGTAIVFEERQAPVRNAEPRPEAIQVYRGGTASRVPIPSDCVPSMPAFRPDGKSIAFLCQPPADMRDLMRGGIYPAIASVALDGSNWQMLVPYGSHGEGEVHLSGDSNGPPDFYKGTGRAGLLDFSRSDGAMLVGLRALQSVVDSGVVAVVAPDGLKVKPPSPASVGKADLMMSAWQGAFMPDGKAVVVTVCAEGCDAFGQPEWYSQVRMGFALYEPGQATPRMLNVFLNGQHLGRPSPSPDGQRIVYALSGNFQIGKSVVNRQVVRTSAQGESAGFELAEGRAPDWQPVAVEFVVAGVTAPAPTTAPALPTPMPTWQVIGSAGSGAGQFQSPIGVATDMQGNIYVADSGNNRAQKLSPSGSPLAQWGNSGTALGQFQGPVGVALDAQGNLFVTEFGNPRIQKFGLEGRPLVQWGSRGSDPGRFQYPYGIALDRQGNIYVADRDNHRIQKLSPDGLPIAQWGSKGTGPGQFQNPDGIAVDPQGNIYVADTFNHRIQKLSPDGRPLAQWGREGSAPGEFEYPGGIALDEAGYVYVADTGNHRVQKLSADGRPVAQWGSKGQGAGQFQSPIGIAVDGQGNILVADYENNRIEKIAVAGG